MMNAVGIDVSKRKSTVTIRRPGDVIVLSPCDIPHTHSAINELIGLIKKLDGEIKVCMEHTRTYHEERIPTPAKNIVSGYGWADTTFTRRRSCL